MVGSSKMQFAEEYFRDYKENRKSPAEAIGELLKREALLSTAYATEVIANEQSKEDDDSLGIVLTTVGFLTSFILSLASAAATLGAFLFRANPVIAGVVTVAGLGGGILAYLTRGSKPGSSSSSQYAGPFEGGSPPAYGGTGPAPRVHDMSGTIRKQQSVIESIVEGAKIVGMDPATMLGIAKAESAFGKYTRTSASSAQGIFQILPSTWRSHYPLFARKYGIPRNDPNDPKSAAIFSAAYAKEILLPKVESAKGGRGTAADLYMMYVFGPAGGVSLIREYAKNSNAYSYEVHQTREYGRAQIRANPTFFYHRDGSPKTLAETFALAQSKVTFTQKENVELSPYIAPAPVEQPATGNQQRLPSSPAQQKAVSDYDIVKAPKGTLVKVMK